MHIAGVDGCHRGWLCIEQNDEALRGCVYETFKALLDSISAEIIAIDVPIGLPDRGSRSCDKIARKLLGPPRASSVFPSPIRVVLTENDYYAACKKHKQIDGRALTKQAFAILPKISEVDSILSASPHLQQRVREVHPELCFAAWNNDIPMKNNKAKLAGRSERELLIDSAWPGQRSKLIGDLSHADFELDDLNDAFAALWTARRIMLGVAKVVRPQIKEIDPLGLSMEMWI